MNMKLFLFLFTICPTFASSEYNLSVISNSHYVIYRVSDEEVLAELKYSMNFWKLDCVNGVKFGENFSKHDNKDNAITTAGMKCKI